MVRRAPTIQPVRGQIRAQIDAIHHTGYRVSSQRGFGQSTHIEGV